MCNYIEYCLILIKLLILLYIGTEMTFVVMRTGFNIYMELLSKNMFLRCSLIDTNILCDLRLFITITLGYIMVYMS